MRKFILLLFPIFLFSYEINTGIRLFYPSIEVYDKKSNSFETLAVIDNKDQFLPVLSLRSDLNYFGKSSWGYFILTDWESFKLNKQDTSNTNAIVRQDLDTNINGFIIYSIPHIYYHINKSNTFIPINIKLALGVGLSYMDIKGDFIITKKDDTNYSTRQNVNSNGLGIAMGILLEFNYDNHSLSHQYYNGSTSDSQYEYYKSSNTIRYNYSIKF